MKKTIIWMIIFFFSLCQVSATTSVNVAAKYFTPELWSLIQKKYPTIKQDGETSFIYDWIMTYGRSYGIKWKSISGLDITVSIDSKRSQKEVLEYYLKSVKDIASQREYYEIGSITDWVVSGFDVVKEVNVIRNNVVIPSNVIPAKMGNHIVFIKWNVSILVSYSNEYNKSDIYTFIQKMMNINTKPIQKKKIQPAKQNLIKKNYKAMKDK